MQNINQQKELSFNNIRLQNLLFLNKNIIQDLQQQMLANKSNKINFIKKLYYKNFENNFDFAKKIQYIISLEEFYIVNNLVNKITIEIIKNFVVDLSI